MTLWIFSISHIKVDMGCLTLTCHLHTVAKSSSWYSSSSVSTKGLELRPGSRLINAALRKSSSYIYNFGATAAGLFLILTRGLDSQETGQTSATNESAKLHNPLSFAGRVLRKAMCTKVSTFRLFLLTKYYPWTKCDLYFRAEYRYCRQNTKISNPLKE